jgi:cobyrinic acid a,c-diamide synthase
MNWMEILTQIFEVCIIPLLGILTVYLVTFINKKKDELVQKSENETLDKYLEMLADTIETCVIATNQTYVESLKNSGSFDAEAQKKAFEDTKTAVLNILGAEAIDYLNTALGDLNVYIEQKIESTVKVYKKV